MAGYIVLGLGFGVLLQSKGYGAGWALVMSGLIYAGSMQYVAIDMLAGGASLISAAIMTLMVNARHLFYGISMISAKDSAVSSTSSQLRTGDLEVIIWLMNFCLFSTVCQR